MTEPCMDEGCVQRIHQLERSLCMEKEEYEERLRVQKLDSNVRLCEVADDSEERLRVQKEEYEERMCVQREQYEKLLLAQQDATLNAYWDRYYPLPLDHFPLEIIALIADFVYDADLKYSHLGAMTLVSRRLRDGVSLSKSWRVVNEVVTHVDDVAELRKILLSRRRSLSYMSTRCENIYLLRYLRLSRDEAISCLPHACGAGRLECLHYLVETFDIEADDICAAIESFQLACMRGHLPVVQYLHTVCGLTAADARAHGTKALRLACTEGHLPVVQYLHAAFGGFTGEACDDLIRRECIRSAQDGGYDDLERFLTSIKE